MTAAEAVARLRAVNPPAADLAVLLSTAIRIEPALIRRVRLLLRHADIGAEVDLWASELLASASPLAMSFLPEAAEVLRAELAGAAYDRLRDTACDLVAAVHADEHWSLRLEERVNRLMVCGDPDAPEHVEQLLLAATAQLRGGDSLDTDPVSTARWLLAALARMPRAAARTEAADVARLSAGTRLDGRLDVQRAAVADAWMPWLLGTARIRPAYVPVRFTGTDLFVNTAGDDDVVIEVPGTDPMVLEVRWQDTTRTHHRRLHFRRNERVSLPLHVAAVELETLAGDRCRLTFPDGVPVGTTAPGIDFSAARAALRPCVGRDHEIERITALLRSGPPAWVVITGRPGAGKSVLLGAVLDRLQRDGVGVAQHFYGRQAQWDEPDTVTASLKAQLAQRPESAIVALDGLPRPDTSTDLHFGRSVLVSSRAVSWSDQMEHRNAVIIDLEPEAEVCAAMLDSRRDELRLAFGGRDVSSTLIALAGAVPGRLTAITDWYADLPIGSARLEDIPVSLTSRIVDTLAGFRDDRSTRALAAVVVARPGCTVADVALVTGDGRFLARAVEAGLVHVEDGLVELTHPSVQTEFVHRFGAGLLDVGHGMHVAVFPHDDPTAATPYQIAAAATHNWYDPEGPTVLRLATNEAFLDRRQRQDGVPQLLADLDLLATRRPGGRAEGWNALRGYNPAERARGTAQAVARAVRLVAAALAAEPERFTDLVSNALRQQGAAKLADELFIDAWPPSLRVQAIDDLDALPALEHHAGQHVVAARSGDLQLVIASAEGMLLEGIDPDWRPLPFLQVEPSGAVARSETLAITDGHTVFLTDLRRNSSTDAALPSSVTSLAAIGHRVLAAGLEDGQLAILAADAEHAAVVHLCIGHAARITTIADVSGRVITGSDDGTVRVWDPETGQCLLRYGRHAAPVRHLAVLGDDTVVSADAKGGMRWWNPATGADRDALSGHTAAVTALVAVASGAVASAGADGALHRWDLRGHDARLTTLQPGGPPIEHAVWCASASLLITVTGDGRLTAWDLAGTRRVDSARPAGVVSPVHGLAWNPMGRRIVVLHAAGASAFPVPPWPAATGAEALGALSLSPGRDTVVYGTADGASMLSLKDGAIRHWLPPAAAARAVGAAVGGDLAMVRQDGECEVSAGPALPGTQHVLVAVDTPLRRHWWVLHRDRRVSSADSRSLTWTTEVQLPADTRSVAVNFAGDFAGGGPDGRVAFASAEPLTVTRQVSAGAGAVDALAFEPEGRSVYAGNADGTLWQILTTGAAADLVGRHAGPVTGVAAPGGRRPVVISVSTDGTARLWDEATRGLLAVVAGPAPFHAVDAIGDLAVARDADGRLWRLDLLPPPFADEVAVNGGFTVTGDLDEANRVVQSRGGATVVRLRYDIQSRESVELRAAYIVVMGEQISTGVDVAQLRVGRLGSALTDPLTTDARLVVPRRLRARTIVPIQQSGTTSNTWHPREVITVAAQLTVFHPAWGEHVLHLSADFGPSPDPSPSDAATWTPSSRLSIIPSASPPPSEPESR